MTRRDRPRSAFPTLAKREWVARGAAIAVIAAVGAAGALQSLAAARRSRDPAGALALAPWDDRAKAELSRRLSGPEASDAQRRSADALARAALRDDPTTVIAAATLGLNAQLRGALPAARAAMGYAGALSRRDLATQLWTIEDAVGRGDVAGALRGYDVALRTSRAQDLLFPVLAAAIADGQVRARLVPVLAARPPWAGSFAEFVAARGTEPVAAAQLFAALARGGVAVPPVSIALLTDRLVSGGKAEEAWALYATLHPQASRARSRDPAFANGGANPTIFDWRLVNEAGISATMQAGLLDFAAGPAVSGPVAAQMLMLPPGRYRLAGRGSVSAGSSASAPFWQIRCGGGPELGQVAMTAARGFAGTVIVPAGCATQFLTLVVRPSDASGGIEGRVERVSVTRISDGS